MSGERGVIMARSNSWHRRPRVLSLPCRRSRRPDVQRQGARVHARIPSGLPPWPDPSTVPGAPRGWPFLPTRTTMEQPTKWDSASGADCRLRRRTQEDGSSSCVGAVAASSGAGDTVDLFSTSASRPGVTHTFVVMCHQCFVTCHPFSSTSPAPILDSLAFSFFL